MASVSKLIIMPIDMWHRLSKDKKEIDVHSIKMVDIPSANQSGGAGGSVNAGGSSSGGASSLSPPFLPSSSPQKEKGEQEEGNPCI